jgi:nucleoside-diphosphate-sugar epimerase
LTTAVTGATGYVGRFVVDRLIEAGVSARAWRRPQSDIRGLPSAVEWIDGGLDRPDSAGALVAGADMLVHCALDHAPGRYRGGEGDDLARFLRLNVGESLALLAAAREAGVRRCVVLSSRAVFGGAAGDGPILDDAPVRPDTHYGAAKAALEAFVRSWGSRDGWAITAIRPTGVYGMVVPAERSKWFDLVARLVRGEAAPARAGTEVHGRDVADAVWRLLTAPPGQVAGRSFNCSDIVVSTRDIARLVHRAAGTACPLPEPAPTPTNVMDCAGLKALGVRFGGWPLFEETVGRLVESVRVAAGAAQSGPTSPASASFVSSSAVRP